MKWIFVLLIFVSGYTMGQTDDSLKYIWYHTQYGMRMPRMVSDSFDHPPYGDTTGRRPFRPGAIMMGLDKKYYKWDGSNWVGIGHATQLTDSSFTVGRDTITIRGTGGGGFDSTSISNRVDQKLNISDTTNKWMNTLRRRSGTDSVEMFKNGSWQYVFKDSVSSGGGGTPGGSNTQIQYNNSGSFAGDAGLTYNATSNTVVTDSARLLNMRINSKLYHADTVLIYGTSIPAGTGQTTIGRFTTTLARRLNAVEGNHGISGATLLVQGLANLSGIPNYDSLKHRAVVFEWAPNDILAGTSAATFISNYSSYIDTILLSRHYPKHRVVVTSPGYLGQSVNANSTLVRQLAFKDSIESMVASKGIRYANVFDAEIFHGAPNVLNGDSVHPNDYGASIYADKIVEALKDSVMSTDQNITVNGYTEINNLKFRGSDTADVMADVMGLNPNGVVVRMTRDMVIKNSYLLPAPQGASISLVGHGYFGNVTSPTSVEVVQVNGVVKATGLRATGGVPTGITGEALNMYYTGGTGYIFAQNTTTNTQLPISLSSFGGQTVIGGLSTSGGNELLYVPGVFKASNAQFTGSPTGTTGAGVEIGTAFGGGYIGGFTRPSGPALALFMQALGGNVAIGGTSDNAIGKLQVTGKVTITTTDSSAGPANMLWIDPITKDIKKAAAPSIINDQIDTTSASTSLTITNGVTRLFIDPSSAISSLAITFPTVPVQGQVLKIYFGGTIQSSALDVVTGGVTSWTITGSTVPVSFVSPTPVKAGTVLIFEYRSTGGSGYWYQMQ